MSDEEQRKEIAKQCGWTKIGWYEDNSGPGFWHGVPPTKLDANCQVVDQHSANLSDYLNDLNAMRGVEVELLNDDNKWEGYQSALRSVTLRDGRECGDLCERLILATASQRAEAFLKALGKWKDDQK